MMKHHTHRHSHARRLYPDPGAQLHGARSMAAPGVALVICLSLLAASCGDSGPGSNNDGGVDGDADPQDAWVDNGPLDCGVRPADGSVCVTGRLYDFQSDEPITPGVENSLFTFFDGVFMREVKYDPDTFMGRLDPNGRFFVWTSYKYSQCLALMDPVSGYLPATINCYSDYFVDHLDYPGEHRYYLIPAPLLGTWQAAYPGDADLMVDRPIFLGQCRNAEWEHIDNGEYTFNSNPSSIVWHRECYPLTEDRTSFVDANATTGDIQPGGAFLYFFPLEFNGNTTYSVDSLGFDCLDEKFWYFDIPDWAIASGEMDFVIINNLPFQ